MFSHLPPNARHSSVRGVVSTQADNLSALAIIILMNHGTMVDFCQCMAVCPACGLVINLPKYMDRDKL